MNCGDCVRICCGCKCWECCCPVKRMTDRYAHIEYKPPEIARRSRVVSDYELVAIQREPLLSYHSKPESSSVRPESKPSYHRSKSTSYKESTIAEKSYQLQPEHTLETSTSESFRQRSTTLPSSTSRIQKPYHMELERTSAVPKAEPFRQRSETLTLPTSHTAKPYRLDPEWTSVVPKSKPARQHSKTVSSSEGHIEKFYSLEPEQTVAQPEPARQRSATFSGSTRVLSESTIFRQRSGMLDSTVSHARSKSLQPMARGSKTPRKPHSVPPYWMAVNGSPRNSASPELSVESSLIDDVAGISEEKIDPQQSLPIYLSSRQTPADSYTTGAVTEAPVLSADERLPPRVPTLQFSLEHDSEHNCLTVHLIQAQNLPAKDIGGSSDPFVKLSLESKICEFLESKVLRRTLNPKFNQSFKFTNLPSKIHQEKLVLEIYDYDRMLVNDFIGEVRVSLKEELLNGDTITMRVNEMARELRSPRGEVLISLEYNPQGRWLEGTVFRAKIWEKQDFWGLADPYVKIRLVHRGTRHAKWKTSIKMDTLSPEYKESFLFDISHMELQDVSLEILIMDYDRFKQNDVVGVVYIGGHVMQESGQTHWSNVLSSPWQHITSWHYILPPSVYKKCHSRRMRH